MPTPEITGFEFDQCLGQGAFGVVWRGRWNGEFDCAVKVLTPGMWHPQYLGWCLEHLRTAERPGLMPVYGYDLMHTPPFLSMALLPEGTATLEDLAGTLPEQEAWPLLENLAGIVARLHSEGIVHTGLSTQNVFVSDGPGGAPVLLVSDVAQGWLTGASTARLHDQCGFIAPEHWRNATRLLQEGRAHGRDVYAFGVIAWRLLTGTWPRGARLLDAVLAAGDEDLNLDPEQFAAWLDKEPLAAWPERSAADSDLRRREIIERCLALAPGARFTGMAEVEMALLSVAAPAVETSDAADDERFVAGHDRASTPAMPSDAPRSAGLAEPNADDIEENDDADFADEEGPPTTRGHGSPRPKLSGWIRRPRAEGRRGVLWPVMTGMLTLVAAGLGYLAWDRHRNFSDLTASVGGVTNEAKSAVQQIGAARKAAETRAREAESAVARLSTAAHDGLTALLEQTVATQPLEERDLDGWRAAVRPLADHTAMLLESAGGPDKPAHWWLAWQLASLKTALGDDAGALPLLETIHRAQEAAAAAGRAADTAGPLGARVAGLTGRILFRQGRTSDALPLLERAAASFDPWVGAHPEDMIAAREFAGALVLTGRAFAQRREPEKARAAFMRVPGLVGKPEDPAFSAEQRFLLADSLYEIGRLDAAAGRIESALTMQMDAVRLLIDYDKQHKKSVQNRTRMAAVYVEMGRLLVRQNTPSEASVAFSQGVNILTELMKEQPENAAVKLDLAVAYNEIAPLVRSARPGPAGAKEALDYQSPGVVYLRALNESTPLDNTIRRHLAASLVLNGELLEAAGTTGDALTRQQEAITLLTELLGESALGEPERRECRRLAARAWSAAASLHEKASRRDAAIAALTKALAEWEASGSEEPADQPVKQAVKDKLKKLKG